MQQDKNFYHSHAVRANHSASFSASPKDFFARAQPSLHIALELWDSSGTVFCGVTGIAKVLLEVVFIDGVVVFENARQLK
ncbi:MAG: hypothetical protein WCA98_07975 [Candidatus Acidiferrales bacterium]